MSEPAQPVVKAGSCKKLRPIAEPFVVKPPSGVSTRTRIFECSDLSIPGGSFADLVTVGTFLGSLYRQTLSSRLSLGDVGYAGAWRKESKHDLTADTSSRWGGAITDRAMDQYDLGFRNLEAQSEVYEAIIVKVSARLAVPVGEKLNGVRGYKDEHEAFLKSRRLAATKDRLAEVKARLDAGRPGMVVGGSDRLKHRSNLEAAGLTVEAWREDWDASRMFLQASGEKGPFGNYTIAVIPSSSPRPDRARLRVRVPHALEAQLGPYLWFEVSTDTHLSEVWLDRVSAGLAVAYRIFLDPSKNRWYLDVSWGLGEAKKTKDGKAAKSNRSVKGAKTSKTVTTPTVDMLAGARRVAVDLNDGHLAVMQVDRYGNPVGEPQTFPLPLDGLKASTRDAYVRHAVTRLVKYAVLVGAKAIAIEDLGFEDSRKTGRETMGRGGRGKKFRKTVAGIPTAKFRARLVAAATRAGLWVIAVDPAYTSKWSKQHWLGPLRDTPKTSTATGHHAAALAVGRRSMGLTLKRRAQGPRGRQSIAAGLPNPSDVKDPTACTNSEDRTPPPENQKVDGREAKRPRKARKTVRRARQFEPDPDGSNSHHL